MRSLNVYVAVQVAAYLLDLSAYWLGCEWGGLGVGWANFCSKITAGAFAFFMHRRFSFPDSRVGTDLSAQLLRYTAILLLNIPLANVVLFWLLRFIAPMPAKIVSDVVLVAFSFLVSRHFIFRSRRQAA